MKTIVTLLFVVALSISASAMASQPTPTPQSTPSASATPTPKATPRPSVKMPVTQRSRGRRITRVVTVFEGPRGERGLQGIPGVAGVEGQPGQPGPKGDPGGLDTASAIAVLGALFIAIVALAIAILDPRRRWAHNPFYYLENGRAVFYPYVLNLLNDLGLQQGGLPQFRGDTHIAHPGSIQIVNYGVMDGSGNGYQPEPEQVRITGLILAPHGAENGNGAGAQNGDGAAAPASEQPAADEAPAAA